MMDSVNSSVIGVLVGPTCPTCESMDCRQGAPAGALWQGPCTDCGTECLWYQVPPDDSPSRVVVPVESVCPACGLFYEANDDSPFCEDCHISDCAYCGVPVHCWMLSENLACRMCEDGEEEAA